MPSRTTLLLVALAAACGPEGSAVGPQPDPIPRPGDFTRVLSFDGRQRSYLLHVPPTAANPPPLVLAFHGVPSSPQEMRAITGFDALADRMGFVVAYPDAVEDWWTGCADCNSLAFLLDIDDVGFVRRLIEQLALDAGIDTRRVYAAGFSNGALFVHRLACDAADRIAAFASVGATALDPTEVPPCDPRGRTPLVLFHGTRDRSFPPEGREFGDGPAGVATLSIDATLDLWAERNGCGSATSRDALPDRVADGTTVTRVTRGGCGGNDLVYYEIEGGGHTWPGSPAQFADFLGPRSDDVVASEEIVAFFLDHRL